MDEDLGSQLLRTALNEFAKSATLAVWITALAEEALEHDDPLKALMSEGVLEKLALRVLAES